MPPESELQRSTKKKRRVKVMRDSLLQGTEAPVWQPDSFSVEVCCLMGARIWDVGERLTKLVQPSDCCSLMLLHVSTSDTARGDLESLKHNYMTWETMAKGMGWFSSQSCLCEGRWILQVNNCLLSWCWQQGFGFYYHGTISLRMKDLCSPKWDKSVFASGLHNLVRIALG